MLFFTLPFLLFATLTVVATNITSTGLSNTTLYLVINVSFLVLFFGRLEAVLLVAFTVWGYAMLRACQMKGRPAGIFGIISTLVLFVTLKKYSFLPANIRFNALPAIIGLSYVLFRVLHLIVDTYQERGPAPGLRRYLNYSLSCFSLVSGPFQRFADHEASIGDRVQGDAMLPLSRICNGFLKTMLLAPVVLSASLWFKNQAHVGALPGVNFRAISRALGARADAGFALISIIAALVWTVFLYLNFSGYTDIVIGWARLCRLDLPENFDGPIRANSFLDFWNRWHMSMTGWFKTYLFTPSLKWLTVRRPQREFILFNTVTALGISFLLMGLWHGPGWAFGICGLLLALGAAVNQSYRELLRRRLGSRRMTALGQSTWYRVPAAGLTFAYTAVVIGAFWMGTPDYLRLLRDMAGPSIVIFAALCVMTGVSVEVMRYAVDTTVTLWTAAKVRGLAPISPSASIAIRLNLLLLAILADYGGVPDFVYKGF